MPGLLLPESASRKRRSGESTKSHSSRKRRAIEPVPGQDIETQIHQLEDQISLTERAPENVAILVSMFDPQRPNELINSILAVALCRVFSRLMAAGSFVIDTSASRTAHRSNEWLSRQYAKYLSVMVSLLQTGQQSMQTTALRLSMRILKEEAEHLGSNIWKESALADLLTAILEAPDGEHVRNTYVNEFVNEFSDCAYYTLDFLGPYAAASESEQAIANVVAILLSLGSPPNSNEDLPKFYASPLNRGKKHAITSRSLKRQAESAWLSVLQSTALSVSLRKDLLRQCSTAILPWLLHPETMMDFLTDSYNIGGSTSLLALSGLFFLINKKNLDYPSFFPKLYSLLDGRLLHGKHRSRFFRLLDTFLSSSHLPASLVASFIKRLARLALFAPPAAIVAIVPYIYNLLRSHPTCTLMIHRDPRLSDTMTTDLLGEDPFDMSEINPQLTHAIDSSLWELETLQSHYHPNVASLARIISEQFTKQKYNLEDFLDHGYATMVDSELGKESKKEPVVEWMIPKHIFKDDGNSEQTGERSLLTQLWSFD